jgi:hypothetical protein
MYFLNIYEIILHMGFELGLGGVCLFVFFFFCQLNFVGVTIMRRVDVFIDLLQYSLLWFFISEISYSGLSYSKRVV